MANAHQSAIIDTLLIVCSLPLDRRGHLAADFVYHASTAVRFADVGRLTS
jgi:hypothetical protein